jgi:biotin transport system ATP-binding protein
MNETHIQNDEPDLSASLIELTDVCFGSDGQDILRNVSINAKFQRVGVVGRNGSGKSTLARILAGLISPNRGTALVNGKNLAKDRRAALSEVGMLFQNPDHQIIFPTVLEEILFGLSQQGHSKAQAQEMVRALLKRFSKQHWENAGTSTLSQGQKHLVCLMSVVAMSPRLLILDEPFAGLDLPTRMQLNRYLQFYNGTLLHITHDPADLEGYPHLIWLDKGTVRQEGPGAEVLTAYVGEMKKRGDQDDISDLTG